MPWRLLLRLLIVAACLAGLAWVVRGLGPERLLAVALRADPLWLGLSLLPILGRFWVWGYKWCRMLARRRPLPYGLALRILAAGSFANLTTPTAKLAGGFVRAALLRRHRGWEMADAYGWSVADQITNVLGHLLLFGLLAIGAGWVLPWQAQGRWLLLAGVAALGIIAALAAARNLGWRLVQRPDVGGRLERILPRRLRTGGAEAETRTLLQRITAPLLHEGSAWSTFIPDLGLAAVSFALICVANAMVMRSLGVDAPLVAISVAVVLGYFAGIAVGGWGGIGVTEVALAGLYVQIGIAPEQAASGVLLHRGIFYAVVLGWGGFSLAREGWSLREVRADGSGD